MRGSIEPGTLFRSKEADSNLTIAFEVGPPFNDVNKIHYAVVNMTFTVVYIITGILDRVVRSMKRHLGKYA